MKLGVLIDSQTKKYYCDYLQGASIPEGYELITSIPPDGLYEPTYDVATQTWKNGLTQEEIDAIKNRPQPPTSEERLKAIEDTILSLMGL